MVYLIKIDNIHFAKRQLKRFKREKDVIWMDKTHYRSASELSDDLLRIAKEKLSLE